MREIPIIHSQHSPPPIREQFIRRGHVHQKLSSISNYPLTLLYAGAGYGKSTALALYVHDSKLHPCWYSISPNDDDIVPFMTKMIQSIQLSHPRFGQSIMKDIQSINYYFDTERIYALASSFINEIMMLKDSIYLFLDDFHHVKNSYEIEQWMLFVLDHIPNNLHIVISSRNKPKWNSLAKLKMTGDLLEIKQQDLQLSLDEMDYILEDILQLNLTDEEVHKIYQLTEGWTIAFNMLAQQLHDIDTIDIIFQNRQSSLDDLFVYLASEVLSNQSLIIQQFLLQSSILDVLSPEECDAILQIKGSEELLQALLEQNLFVSEGEGNSYRYHALFKVFLENQLYRKYKEEYDTLHNRAAHYFERKQKYEQALHHFRKIKRYNEMTSILKDYGEVMLQTGRLQNLYEILSELPEESKEIYPVLYFYQGEIERYRSLYEEAEENYDKIISSVPAYDQNHYYLIGLAFEGKARIYLDTIQPDRAERFVKQAINMREKSHATKEEMAQLYQLMAENLLNSGQASKAEAWLERAKGLNLPMEEGNLQARIFLRTGKLAKAKELLWNRKQQNRHTDSKHLPQSHRETDLLLSIIAAFMGDIEESKQLASEGIQLGLKIKSPFVEACGWMRMGHAVQLLEQYNGELAEKCYNTALEIMESINVARGKAEPYMGLSILLGKRLEYDRALETAHKGLHETEKVKDKWLSALIILGMITTAVHNRKFKEAIPLLAEAKDLFLTCGDRYGEMVVSFWRAYIAYEHKEDHLFTQEMTNFLTLMETEGYEFFLKKTTTFGPSDMQNMAPLLLQAKKLEILPQTVSRYIFELHLDETMNHHPGYTLTIQTLGHFKVWIGNRPIETKSWQREKARELFELLVTFRHRLVAKEEIFLKLWPDLDEEAANKNFKVTFNTLLKVLEPKRKARQEPYFIIRKGSSYGVNPNAYMDIDAVTFEKNINQGLEEKDPKRAIEFLQTGLNQYKGMYLEDLRLVEWCTQERERLQLIFLRGAEKMAQCSVRLQDYNTCMDWCEKILAIDHTWEEAYRLLMYSYYQQNNRPQAIKWYEKCCHVLEAELGVTPMGPTKEMYQMIIESEELNTY